MNDAKTIGSNALVLDTAEENVTVMNAEESKLGKEVSLIEQRAEAVIVASGADFEDAGLFLKQIKQAQKQVKDYCGGKMRRRARRSKITSPARSSSRKRLCSPESSSA